MTYQQLVIGDYRFEFRLRECKSFNVAAVQDEDNPLGTRVIVPPIRAEGVLSVYEDSSGYIREEVGSDEKRQYE